MGMCALGLALEAMITLLTPRFVPFFLVLLVRRSALVFHRSSLLPPFLLLSPSFSLPLFQSFFLTFKHTHTLSLPDARSLS